MTDKYLPQNVKKVTEETVEETMRHINKVTPYLENRGIDYYSIGAYRCVTQLFAMGRDFMLLQNDEQEGFRHFERAEKMYDKFAFEGKVDKLVMDMLFTQYLDARATINISRRRKHNEKA